MTPKVTPISDGGHCGMVELRNVTPLHSAAVFHFTPGPLWSESFTDAKMRWPNAVQGADWTLAPPASAIWGIIQWINRYCSSTVKHIQYLLTIVNFDQDLPIYWSVNGSNSCCLFRIMLHSIKFWWNNWHWGSLGAKGDENPWSHYLSSVCVCVAEWCSLWTILQNMG